MKSKKVVLYLFLCILSGGLACSCQNRPKDVLNRKQMERLMYDIYIAEATMDNDYQNFNTPEKKEAYINRVFKAHKTTQMQWDSSLSWYSDRIDIYLKMNDSVKARLQRARREIDALLAQQNQAQQTDPALRLPSYIPPFYTFSTPDTRKGFRFRLDSTEIFSKVSGDDFLFTFSVLGIPPRFSRTFTSLLTLVYSDTTIYRFQEIRENRSYDFTASKYITGDTISEAAAFVHLQDSTGMIPAIQLYDIFFGDMPATSLETDSTRLETDTVGVETGTVRTETDSEITEADSVRTKSENLHAEPLVPDTVKRSDPDAGNPLKPASGGLRRPDSQRIINSGSRLLLTPDSIKRE